MFDAVQSILVQNFTGEQLRVETVNSSITSAVVKQNVSNTLVSDSYTTAAKIHTTLQMSEKITTN